MENNYSQIVNQARAVLADEINPVANAANLAALIYHEVEQLNWAGFYFLRDEELVLGPFQGQLACNRIALGQGVCGTAFAESQTLVVDDVHQFDGHIACDTASESEIVVPFTTDGLSGVLDIDSPIKARFGENEKTLFECLTQVYCDSIC